VGEQWAATARRRKTAAAGGSHASGSRPAAPARLLSLSSRHPAPRACKQQPERQQAQASACASAPVLAQPANAAAAPLYGEPLRGEDSPTYKRVPLVSRPRQHQSQSQCASVAKLLCKTTIGGYLNGFAI